METTNEDPGKSATIGMPVSAAPPRRQCYLVAHIQPSTMTVLGVATYSDPPWGLTRMFGKGRSILAIVLETSGEDYQEALDSMYECYPSYEPELAERFPLPVRENREGEVLTAIAVSGAYEPEEEEG